MGLIYLNGAKNIGLVEVDVEAVHGTDNMAAIGMEGGTNGVKVINSRIWGGGRTIFLRGGGERSTWASNTLFHGNTVGNGRNACWQFSGGKNSVIERNTCAPTTYSEWRAPEFRIKYGEGILLAGAADVLVSRNRIHGPARQGTPEAAATRGRLGTPRQRHQHDVGRCCKRGPSLGH